MNGSSIYNNSCVAPLWLNIVYSTAGLVIVFENMLMIVVIIRTPRLHNIANIFVTSLAVTDVIVGCIDTMTGFTFGLVKPSDWMFKYLYLAITATMLGTTMCAYLHITLIAIDRYVYIAHPFFYYKHVNTKLILKCLLALWCLVLVYMMGTVLSIKRGMVCLIKDLIVLDSTYVGSWIALFLILVTSLAYFRIAALSLRHRRSIASVNIAVLPSTSPNPQDNTRSSISEENRTHVLKTVRFFLVMTGSFAAMTVPVTICNFVYRNHVYLNTTLLNVVGLLPTLQSGFNFFINIFMNSDFRQAVTKMFLCRVAS